MSLFRTPILRRPKSDPLPFFPRFAHKIVSGRHPPEIIEFCPIPSIQLPVLERRYEHLVVRRVDPRRLARVCRRRPLDHVMDIIARLLIERRRLQLRERFRRVETGFDTGLDAFGQSDGEPLYPVQAVRFFFKPTQRHSCGQGLIRQTGSGDRLQASLRLHRRYGIDELCRL